LRGHDQDRNRLAVRESGCQIRVFLPKQIELPLGGGNRNLQLIKVQHG
jgi:hypothetical protein